MPDQEPTFHRHPNNVFDAKYGVKLRAGDVVEATDVYSSTDGKWQPCPCPGLTLTQGADRIWVRPMPEPEGTIRPGSGQGRPVPDEDESGNETDPANPDA